MLAHQELTMMLRPSLGMLVPLVETCLVMQICTLLVQVLDNVQVSSVSSVLQWRSFV